MKKIKIAQIGTEHDHASAIYDTLRTFDDIFDFVGFARTDEEKSGLGQNFYQNTPRYKESAEYALEEIFAMPDLDAVAIETEDRYLVKYAKLAAEHGLHVHMDKPGSQTAEDFESMLSEIKKRGKIFSIGYMYRFNPALLALKARIDAGEYGEIFSTEAEMSIRHPKRKRDWLGGYQGGMTAFLGCHLIDLTHWLRGIPEEILSLNAVTGYQGCEAEDFGLVVMKYKNGHSILRTNALKAGGYQSRNVLVCGTRGTAEVRPTEMPTNGYYCDSPLYEYKPSAENPDQAFGLTELHTPFNAHRYERMMRDFAERIIRGEQGAFSLEYEARSHRMFLCACGIPYDYKEEIKL